MKDFIYIVLLCICCTIFAMKYLEVLNEKSELESQIEDIKKRYSNTIETLNIISEAKDACLDTDIPVSIYRELCGANC